jgi:hypothetical protein
MTETYCMSGLVLDAPIVPVAGKVVEVATVPECNLCRFRAEKSVPSRFDAYVPTVGTWAYVCPSCYMSEGCRIGTGAGQVLFVANETVRTVRADMPEMPGIALLIRNV